VLTLAINLAIVDERQLKFKAVINCLAPSATSPETITQQDIEVCDPNGKVRVWSDVDSAIRALSKGVVTLNNLTFNVPTGTLVPQYSINLTAVQIAQKKLNATVKMLVTQSNRVAKANQDVADANLFNSPTATLPQKAKYAELVAMRDTAVAQQAFLISERDKFIGQGAVLQ
jgi:hypothetical protein